MTLPKIETKTEKGSRYYIIPGNEGKIPGVTSVLNMLPKDLQHWAAYETAKEAVESLPQIVGIAMRDKEAAITHLKHTPYRITKGAADMGTAAHALFEQLALGADPGRLEPDMLPFRRHFEDFLDQAQPKFLQVEETVWSQRYNYAGSFDAMADIDGQRVILDWKTTRSGIHPQVGLQLAAYRFSDFLLHEDGSQEPTPKVDGAAVLHIRPEGWSLVPVVASRTVFDNYFLPLLRTFEFETKAKKKIIGTPAYSGGEAPRYVADEEVAA